MTHVIWNTKLRKTLLFPYLDFVWRIFDSCEEILFLGVGLDLGINQPHFTT